MSCLHKMNHGCRRWPISHVVHIATMNSVQLRKYPITPCTSIIYDIFMSFAPGVLFKKLLLIIINFVLDLDWAGAIHSEIATTNRSYDLAHKHVCNHHWAEACEPTWLVLSRKPTFPNPACPRKRSRSKPCVATHKPHRWNSWVLARMWLSRRWSMMKFGTIGGYKGYSREYPTILIHFYVYVYILIYVYV
jgi:hypothetical protein